MRAKTYPKIDPNYIRTSCWQGDDESITNIQYSAKRCADSYHSYIESSDDVDDIEWPATFVVVCSDGNSYHVEVEREMVAEFEATLVNQVGGR